jgi:hypothetical protein
LFLLNYRIPHLPAIDQKKLAKKTKSVKLYVDFRACPLKGGSNVSFQIVSK